MVETALVMPLYMLVVLGLLYFGYATLHRQRLVKAAAFAAWMPGDQPADVLLSQFWLSGGREGPQPVDGDTWKLGDDLTLGPPPGERIEYPSQDDDYYGHEIHSQLTTGPLAGGWQGDTFDRERLAVTLWNYALGETTQSFVWDPAKGIVEQTNTSYDSIALYLNGDSSGAVGAGGGFVLADEGNPPSIESCTGWIAAAFNGPGQSHWLERRHATLEASYVPPYFPAIFHEADQAPSDLRTFVDFSYSTPSYKPVAAAAMDLTGRTPGVSRLAAGEGGDVLQDVANLLGFESLPVVDDAPNPAWKSK